MDIKEKLKELEEHVSLIKDPELKKVAFEKLLSTIHAEKSHHTQKKKTLIKGERKQARFKSRRPGPKKILTQLLNSGYFDGAKISTEIPCYLKHKTGYDYRKEEISSTLTRLLRDELLTREKNKTGQYTWKKAK